MTDLKALGLARTNVTDAGLEKLKRLTKLTHLDLSATQVTNEGIKELQEALPNCKIHWTPPTPKTNLDQP
ncbi:MAG: hypothetical protein H8E44_45440 [Planctomycetes bacterium]|nr:hypothetical protein [Planctomycetota bacterium]